MAGKGVRRSDEEIRKENVEELREVDGVGGGGWCSRRCVPGVCTGDVDRRRDWVDDRCDNYRLGVARGCARHLRFPRGAAYGGALIGLGTRALLIVGALAFCLAAWADVTWAVVPTLEKVVPDTVVAGSLGVSLAIQGTGIDANTVVYWGATSLATTVYGSTAAVAAVSDSLVESVGIGVVSLENLDGSSNAIGVLVVESIAQELEPVLYVLAGLLGATAFIWGMGSRW